MHEPADETAREAVLKKLEVVRLPHQAPPRGRCAPVPRASEESREGAPTAASRSQEWGETTERQGQPSRSVAASVSCPKREKDWHPVEATVAVEMGEEARFRG